MNTKQPDVKRRRVSNGNRTPRVNFGVTFSPELFTRFEEYCGAVPRSYALEYIVEKILDQREKEKSDGSCKNHQSDPLAKGDLF